MGDAMRPMTLGKFKRRRAIKGLIISVPVIICAYFLGLLEARAMGMQTRTFHIGLMIYAILWLLSIPLFAKIKKRTESEYENAEQLFEETGSQLILDAFGEAALRKLDYNDQNAIFPTKAIDVCREMLQSKESENSANLKFHLMVRFARYYAKDGQPQKSIECLLSALAANPTSLIANCRIATLFERMGKGAEAIIHYELAQRDKAVSPSLKNYIAEQIQRVKTCGPREKGPFDGSGIQWMWGS